jgi:hypothetical protein
LRKLYELFPESVKGNSRMMVFPLQPRSVG